MEKTDNATKNVDESTTSFKKLHTVYESGEFSDCQKRIAEIKKRVEALYTAERAKLIALQQEREKSEEKSEQDQSTVNTESVTEQKEQSSPPQVSVTAAETVKEPPAQAVVESESAPVEKVEKPYAPESGTRTAIPSYIRGVVKHTPRPAPTERSPRPDRGSNNRTPGFAPRPSTSRPSSAPIKLDLPAQPRKRPASDKKTFAKVDDKRPFTKRTLIRKGYINDSIGEERMGARKLKNKKVNKVVPFAPIKIEKAVITTENLTVKILSEKIGKTAQEIIKQLMQLGIMTTINSVVDFATMQLVADSLGVEIELKLDKTKEEVMLEQHAEPDPEDSLVKRPPIITVMGHVDHGKTSLLDAIRKTTVAEGEAGGITQHIGAYSVDVNGEKITFLDTPGHEAFSEMRRRGAIVTDIAVLVVAADDGIMPQTVEAIHHAQAANVPIVVAINKIDKPGANSDKIRQTLTEHGLVCEEWGGDTPMIEISAKQRIGIEKLLENILFRAEYMGLRANPDRSARGYVIEARLDKGKGPIASVIVQNGTLKVGDYIVSGVTYGRVRSMTDDKGRVVKSAGPSMPVAVFGLAQVPQAGDPIVAVESEKMARQVIEERAAKVKNDKLSDVPQVSLEDAFGKLADENMKDVNVVVKADVQGSCEALKDALLKLTNEEVKVNVVHSGVGAIKQSDIMMAEVAKAVIIGFNVKADSDARTSAERLGINIKLFSIIYDVIDFVQSKMDDLVAPKMVERVTGKAQVRTAFKVSGVGIIAGSYVTSGKIVRNGKARLYRGDKVIFEGDICGLKRFKDDAKEVTVGYECGIALNNYTDFLENDEIECYVVEKEVK